MKYPLSEVRVGREHYFYIESRFACAFDDWKARFNLSVKNQRIGTFDKDPNFVISFWWPKEGAY